MLIRTYLCGKRAENIYQHMRQWYMYFSTWDNGVCASERNHFIMKSENIFLLILYLDTEVSSPGRRAPGFCCYGCQVSLGPHSVQQWPQEAQRSAVVISPPHCPHYSLWLAHASPPLFPFLLLGLSSWETALPTATEALRNVNKCTFACPWTAEDLRCSEGLGQSRESTDRGRIHVIRQRLLVEDRSGCGVTALPAPRSQVPVDRSCCPALF